MFEAYILHLYQKPCPHPHPHPQNNNICFDSVTPIYYVFFTTATIFASAVLFDSFHTDPDNQKKPNPDGVKNIVSVIAGFITIFIGVFMLNSKKSVEVNRGSSIALRSLGHRNSFSLAISGSRSRMDINEHHLLKNMSSAHPNSDEEEMN